MPALHLLPKEIANTNTMQQIFLFIVKTSFNAEDSPYGMIPALFTRMEALFFPIIWSQYRHRVLNYQD